MEKTIMGLAVIRNCPVEDMDTEDAGLDGVYEIEVDSDLNRPDMASAALDGFHSSVAVSCLDDFVFLVFDLETGEVVDEPDDREGYALEHKSGGVFWTGAETPGVFDVTIEEITVRVVADTAEEAAEKTMRLVDRQGSYAVETIYNRQGDK